MDQHSSAIEIFCCYAREDEDLLNKLKSHLRLLQRQNLIDVWYDGEIPVGTARKEEIEKHLNNAHIILLLLSSYFIASDYCYDTQMTHALERHARGEATVVPVILRPIVDLPDVLNNLQVLPKNGKAITTWDNRDEAFVAVARELSHIIGQPSFPDPSLSSVEPDDRRMFLNRVRRICIEECLEQPLYQSVRMKLYLQEKPDAIENPWRSEFPVDEVSRPLLPATTIIQIYDKADGQLLILGKPGAGKTTLLLELARELLSRAQNNERYPMPVVFNLCSWAEKRQPLSTWLVEQLHLKYHVPTNLGQAWVNTDSLLPLLDGLDEVAEQYRHACVEAINTYQLTHSIFPMVVCSRSDDYSHQSVLLWLQRAVVIQPLTHEQIDDYLTQLGEQGEALREALQMDSADLQELVTNPLILSILGKIALETLRSEILSSDSLDSLDSLDAKRQRIFATYVASALMRRQKKYTEYQILRWLAKLARQLVKDNRTEFYIERMQFNWLEKEQSDWLTRVVLYLFRCIIGVSVAIPGILSFVLTRALSFDLLEGLIFGLIGFFLVNADLVKKDIVPAEKVTWSLTNVRQGLVDSLFSLVEMGLFVVLLAVLLIMRIILFLDTSISLSFLLKEGIVLIVGGALLLFIQSGWTSIQLDEKFLTRPNQGIWSSGRHGLMVGLLFGVVSGLMFSWLSSPVDGFVCGWTIGLAMGLLNGGMACVKHAFLRWHLWCDKSIPWRYSRFLNYAAEHMLLRKEGAGYLFVHRLLQDYFANLDMPSPPK